MGYSREGIGCLHIFLSLFSVFHHNLSNQRYVYIKTSLSYSSSIECIMEKVILLFAFMTNFLFARNIVTDGNSEALTTSAIDDDICNNPRLKTFVDIICDNTENGSSLDDIKRTIVNNQENYCDVYDFGIEEDRQRWKEYLQGNFEFVKESLGESMYSKVYENVP